MAWFIQSYFTYSIIYHHSFLEWDFRTIFSSSIHRGQRWIFIKVRVHSVILVKEFPFDLWKEIPHRRIDFFPEIVPYQQDFIFSEERFFYLSPKELFYQYSSPPTLDRLMIFFLPGPSFRCCAWNNCSTI